MENLSAISASGRLRILKILEEEGQQRPIQSQDQDKQNHVSNLSTEAK
jgi:hypothetical protein